MPGPVEMWRQNREAVREAVLNEGYDPEVGAFVQAFGSKALDAGQPAHPRGSSFCPLTTPACRARLTGRWKSLPTTASSSATLPTTPDDGLPGDEGGFGLTTFWLVDALALSGRLEEARALFEGMVGARQSFGALRRGV